MMDCNMYVEGILDQFSQKVIIQLNPSFFVEEYIIRLLLMTLCDHRYVLNFFSLKACAIFGLSVCSYL